MTPQIGDWVNWQHAQPAGCTCHWSDLRERQVPPPARFAPILLPPGTWRYALRDPACPWHGDHG